MVVYQVQAGSQMWEGAGGGVFVAGAKLQSQTQSAPPLVGQERRIGSLALVGIVVADRGSFLAAVDRQLGGIHVHHSVPAKSQALEELLAQEIVGSLEISEGLDVEAPKELSEGVAVREVRQTQ